VRRDDEHRAPGRDPQVPTRSAPSQRRNTAWVRDDGAGDEWADSEPSRGRSRSGRQQASSTRRDARTTSRAGGRSTAARPASSRDAFAALSAKRTLPPELAAAIRNAADTATTHHREVLVERAEAAQAAYERGRYLDALRAIKPVAEEAPSIVGVRELAGLAAYRSGRWREAVRHLEVVGELGDAVDYLPVLMDCQRALHKPKKVAELWSELRQRSPEPDVLAEGRIVAAAALADAGDLNGAIAMLATAGAAKALRNPSDRHIRQWYLLGDLYERAGDVPRAREYFERVQHADAGAYDVTSRLASLGPDRRRRTATRRPKTTKSTPPRTSRGTSPRTSTSTSTTRD
jgi:tetratricopeptide (TPR) repeat protein